LSDLRQAEGSITARRWIVYKSIVLAYDGSEPGQKALLDCQEIGQWSHARLHLVAVMPPPLTASAVEIWSYSPELDEAERSSYQSVLDSGVDRLRDAGLEVQGELTRGDSVDEIVRVARAAHAELIVVGHKHLESWAERWWRGSVSKSLIEHAPCSVLVVITP
jgi:nucleotide-binding universal stress UspA family protein